MLIFKRPLIRYHIIDYWKKLQSYNLTVNVTVNGLDHSSIIENKELN